MSDQVARTSEYFSWVAELRRRYRATQIKAAISVNSALLEFYWQLGRDVCERYPGKKRNARFFERLSADLQSGLENTKGLSPTNIKYSLYFYQLYYRPQLVDDKTVPNRPQVVDDLVRIPWGHHRLIIDKCGDDLSKALFYVHRTIENNWSRNVLLNWISTDLYAREGKALTNFREVLPPPDGDLAQQLTKDPYIFEVQGLKQRYDEAALKKAMVRNIEKVLMELGRGFSFVGREFTLTVGGQEKSVDLLFYLIPQHRYFVVEVKLGEFEPADLGQLQGYVAACDLTLNGPLENPAMGLVICKGKNSTLVRYMLGRTDMPLGVSEYELSGVVPDDFKSDLPSIEDLEAELAALENGGGAQ